MVGRTMFLNMDGQAVDDRGDELDESVDDIIERGGWVEPPIKKIIVDGLQEVVGFALDDTARFQLHRAIFVYLYHPVGGLPQVDYDSIIRAFIRRASCDPETRNFAVHLALSSGREEEIQALDSSSSPPVGHRTGLPIKETKSLSSIKQLISVLGRVEGLTRRWYPPRCEQDPVVSLPERYPVEYGLEFAKFRNDIAEAKERVLEDFPTLQHLLESELNERRLRDALLRVVKAREARPIARKGEKRRRKKDPNWKKITFQQDLYEILKSAAERANVRMTFSDFDRFLELLNMFLPREARIGTAQAVRDSYRKR